MSTHTLAVNRREFLEIAGAGLLIVAAAPPSEAQRGGGAGALETRLHIGEDGFITILTGKVEEGQGALTELSMAAAEELRVPLEPRADGHGGYGPGAERRNHRRQRDDAPDDAAGAQRGGGGAPIAAGRGRPAVERGCRAARGARWRCHLLGQDVRLRRTGTLARTGGGLQRRIARGHVSHGRKGLEGIGEAAGAAGRPRHRHRRRIAILAILCGRACSTAACCERRLTGRR